MRCRTRRCCATRCAPTWRPGSRPREALRAAAPALERQLGGSFAHRRPRHLRPAGAPPHLLLRRAPAPDPDGPRSRRGDHRRARLRRSARATRPAPARPSSRSRASTALLLHRRRDRGTRRRRSSTGSGGSRGRWAQLRASTSGERAARRARRSCSNRVAAETDRRPDDMAACLLGARRQARAPADRRARSSMLDAREAAGKRARRFLTAAGVAEARDRCEPRRAPARSPPSTAARC